MRTNTYLWSLVERDKGSINLRATHSNRVPIIDMGHKGAFAGGMVWHSIQERQKAWVSSYMLGQKSQVNNHSKVLLWPWWPDHGWPWAYYSLVTTHSPFVLHCNISWEVLLTLIYLSFCPPVHRQGEYRRREEDHRHRCMPVRPFWAFPQKW